MVPRLHARGRIATRCSRNRASYGMRRHVVMSTGGGYLGCDFVLNIPNPLAARVFLPPMFSRVVSKLGLEALWLEFQASYRPLMRVELRVDSSGLTFLASGWQEFSRGFDLRAGDILYCSFDGDRILRMSGFSAERDCLQPSLEGTNALVMNGGEASLPSSPEKSAVVSASESPTNGICSSGAGEKAGGAREESDGALSSVLRK